LQTRPLTFDARQFLSHAFQLAASARQFVAQRVVG
jgi:hypothetical protein